MICKKQTNKTKKHTVKPQPANKQDNEVNRKKLRWQFHIHFAATSEILPSPRSDVDCRIKFANYLQKSYFNIYL